MKAYNNDLKHRRKEETVEGAEESRRRGRRGGCTVQAKTAGGTEGSEGGSGQSQEWSHRSRQEQDHWKEIAAGRLVHLVGISDP